MSIRSLDSGQRPSRCRLTMPMSSPSVNQAKALVSKSARYLPVSFQNIMGISIHYLSNGRLNIYGSSQLYWSSKQRIFNATPDNREAENVAITRLYAADVIVDPSAHFGLTSTLEVGGPLQVTSTFQTSFFFPLCQTMFT